MSVRHRLLVACALLIAPNAASAQDGLLLGGRYISASRAFGDLLGPGPLLSPDQIFGGGRYALISDTVFDSRTGQPVYVTPEFVLAVDPARPRLFERRSDGVVAVNVNTHFGYTVLPGAGAAINQCGLAYSVEVLYCAVGRSDGLVDVVAVDLAAGVTRTVAAVALAAPPSFFPVARPTWLVTPDGTHVYFSERPGTLASLATATGAVRHSDVPVDGASWDDANERVISLSGQPTVLDKDLNVLARSASPGDGCSAVQVSPHTGRMYVYTFQYGFRRSTASETMQVFDAATLAPLTGSVARQPTEQRCQYMTVLTAPGAPRRLAARVTGRDVLLTWTNVGAASHFVLDVGFAPGRTDAQFPLGADAHATFANVPPGTYYLRLRGGNEFGGGRASNEILVIVP